MMTSPLLFRHGSVAVFACRASQTETHDHASLSAFLDAIIGNLVACDQKRGAELAPTLLSYFDSNQNARVAAERQNIHVSTMRQRLTTIEDLIGHGAMRRARWRFTSDCGCGA